MPKEEKKEGKETMNKIFQHSLENKEVMLYPKCFQKGTFVSESIYPGESSKVPEIEGIRNYTKKGKTRL